jgi:hypothetical protein
MNAFSFFFLLSGFCAMVYQIVWLRIAMADFGVTTAHLHRPVDLYGWISSG